MATLARRLTDIGALADLVADKYDEDRDVVDLADRHVTGMLKALNGVLALAETWRYKGPFSAWQEGNGPDEASQVLDVAAASLRQIIDGAIRTTEPDAADLIMSGQLPMPLCQNVSMAGRRYSQCDSTCTTDCGHCKGHGRPDELDRFVAAADAGRDDHQRERAALGGVA